MKVLACLADARNHIAGKIVAVLVSVAMVFSLSNTGYVTRAYADVASNDAASNSAVVGGSATSADNSGSSTAQDSTGSESTAAAPEGDSGSSGPSDVVADDANNQQDPQESTPEEAVQDQQAEALPSGEDPLDANVSWALVPTTNNAGEATYQLKFYGTGTIAKDFINRDDVRQALGEYLTQISSISIYAGITGIGEGAFAGMAQLEYVAIDFKNFQGSYANLVEIGAEAFADCINLESANLSATQITAIPAGCFAGCNNLKVVGWPDTLQSIEADAFYACNSLPQATLDAAATYPTAEELAVKKGESQQDSKQDANQQDAAQQDQQASTQDGQQNATQDTEIGTLSNQYVYEDNAMKVVATLSNPSALPEGTTFTVSELTGWNFSYGGNVSALKQYAQDNNKILESYKLYDYKFINNGQVVEPASGTVTLNVTFKSALQLGLNGEAIDAENVEVVHLEKQADGSLVGVDVTKPGATQVEGSTVTQMAAQTDSFSAFAFANLLAAPTPEPGTPMTFQDILGSSLYYGIVANDAIFTGHLESNFAIGTLHGNCNVQMPKNSGGGAGVSYIGAYVDNNFFIDLNGNSGESLVYTTDDAAAAMGSNMSRYDSATGHYYSNRQGIILDTTTYTEAQIQDYVASLVDEAKTTSANLAAEQTAINFSDVYQNGSIDLTGYEDGTYYINFAEGEYAQYGSWFTTKINPGQNVVFNIPDAEVNLQSFNLNITGVGNYASNGYQEPMVEHVTFNCYNATQVNVVGSIDAVVLAPYGDFYMDAVSGGWVVANTISKIGGAEWHNMYSDVPVIKTSLEAKKTVDGAAPSEDENNKFTFELYQLNSDGETLLQTKTNNGGAVAFDQITYTEAGTYWYKIVETGNVDGYTTDSSVYFARVDVTKAGNGFQTPVVYYSTKVVGDKLEADTVVGSALFNNKKGEAEKGALQISKTFVGEVAAPSGDAAKSIEFIITGPDGFAKTINYSEFENGTYTLEDLAVGNYTVVEKNGYDVIGYTHSTSMNVTDGKVSVVANETAAVNVTNTYNKVEVTTASVSKVWDDADNRDGKRPTSVSVQLKADGVNYGEPVTLDASNSWSYEWGNLPKVNGDTDIVYTVEETSVPDGYTVEVSQAQDGSFVYTVTNTHEAEKTQVSGTKTWNDNNNQDGVRPASITVNLLADGQKVASQTVEPDENGNWAYSFTDLPKYENGTQIAYTVTEDAVASYTTAIEGYNITNSHETEKTSVSGTKTWSDADNQDGKRPASITVRLMNGDTEVASKTVTAADNWQYSFTDLPKYANGQEIQYTITEDAVAEYTTQVNGYDLVNTHTTETTQVSGTKTWNDANNQDGKRPASITVKLIADGQEVASKTVTAGEDGSWSYSFTNLPKYAAGQEIRYTVQEADVENYTASYEGTNIINTYAPETVSVSGSKTWNDNNNQDGVRPTEITINLLADGTQVQSKTVTANDNWAYSFTDLPKYADGKLITYTITEGEVANYSSEVNGYNVINTHTTETTEVSGAKTWNDSDNQDGLRPDSITVNLFANGEQVKTQTVEPDENGNWNYSFKDLPKNSNGQAIAYTVTEDVVAGYEAVVDGFNIANNHTTETTVASVKKVWDDNNNQDGVRPDSVSVQLLADGVAYGQAVTLNEGNGWAYNWSELPKNSNGKAIEYTVAELTVEGYTSTIAADEQGIFAYTITNSHTTETTQVSGTKTWNDSNNQDGKRPASITVRLMNGETQVASKTVTAADNWKYSFTDLPKYANGQEIQYTIIEDAVAEYTTQVDGYDVINTHTTETTQVSGTKTWNDANNQDGVRPAQITVNLLADGVQKDSVTLSAGEDRVWQDNELQYSFNDLPKYAAGKEIVYTVQEVDVEGYTAAVEGYNLQNTHETDKTQVSVSKAWNDSENQDGIRPASVSVQLKAGDQNQGEAVELNASNNWTYTWTGLEKNANGTAINYTVEEVNVPENYSCEITGGANEDGSFSYTATNTHTTEKTEVSGTKIWDDNNNQDGKRPSSITVRLYANGTEVDSQTVTPDANGNWSYSFTGLDKNSNGKEIEYTVSEDAVEGYNTKVEGTAIEGYTITNTHETDKTQVFGTKDWDDAMNQDGKRPESITINLLADGEQTQSQTVTPDENGSWSYSFDNLPKFKDGKEIVYTITEDEVADYTTEVSGYNVKNTHAPELTSFSGVKVWNDANNQDGKRPTSITLKLMRQVGDGEAAYVVDENGEIVSQTLTATGNDGAWTEDDLKFSFTDLPKYSDGTEIVYSVVEDTVADYETAYGTDENGAIVTNTHEAELTEFSGVKVWNDANNQDGVRPASITLNLMQQVGEDGKVEPAKDADGKAITATLEATGEDGAWQASDLEYSFKELPKYSNGTEIIYSVEEDAVKGYTASIDGTTVTNTHETETVDLAVQKDWNDNDNAYKLRPESVTAQVLSNGQPLYYYPLPADAADSQAGDTSSDASSTGSDAESAAVAPKYGYTIDSTVEGAQPVTITLNQDNEWKGSWTGLPKNEAGKAIAYTVTETVMAGDWQLNVENSTFTKNGAVYSFKVEAAQASGNQPMNFTITNSLEVGDLVIDKSFVGTNGNAYDGTVVFHVRATTGTGANAATVFDQNVGMTFANGVTSNSVTISGLPVGATVEVTEEYAGAGAAQTGTATWNRTDHTIQAAPKASDASDAAAKTIGEVTISEDAPSDSALALNVAFTNDYDDYTTGSGVVNRYSSTNGNYDYTQPYQGGN